MGLFDFFKNASSKPSIDLSDLKFVSDNHIRYEDGKDISGRNKDSWRGVRVQTNILGGEGYTVTIYNLDSNHSLWDNNIHVSPKQMKIIEQNESLIKLRGFGTDNIGIPFSGYGLSLHLSKKRLEKVTLHLIDRNVDILYFKALQQFNSAPSISDDFERFKLFVVEWNNTISMDKKMDIAFKSDGLNNIAASFYEDGDIEKAIKFFEQALLIMPNNDDALKNLQLCYSETNNNIQLQEVNKKLKHLKNVN
jgi:tetratricopeptide (TPR) repeat protein